jgi:hypothetical protein
LIVRFSSFNDVKEAYTVGTYALVINILERITTSLSEIPQQPPRVAQAICGIDARLNQSQH